MILRACAGKGLASPNKIGVVDQSVLANLCLESQSQVAISTDNAREVIWIYASKADVLESVEWPSGSKQASLHDLKVTQILLLSKRARELLALEHPSDVDVTIPATIRLNIAPALITDLPRGDEVHVAKKIARTLEAGNGWGLLVLQECSIPVQLRAREMKDDRVRLSMLTRTLLCATDTDPIHDVQLSALLHVSWPLLRAPIRRLRGLINRFIEFLLRPLLGSPRIALGTTQALVGDDNEQVARLNPSVFPLLGIKPGDHIIVSWAKRQVFAIALEAEDVADKERESLRKLQMVNLFIQGESKVAARHLVIGLSAKLRAELGIPLRTAVMVRRRLAATFVGQLNQLVLPICGLALAAARFPNVPAIAWILGFSLVLAVGMFPVRHRKPPQGRLS